MTVNELRLLYQQQAFKEAEILQDAILPGWIVEFRGQDGRLYEMTDTLGSPSRSDRSKRPASTFIWWQTAPSRSSISIASSNADRDT